MSPKSNNENSTKAKGKYFKTYVSNDYFQEWVKRSIKWGYTLRIYHRNNDTSMFNVHVFNLVNSALTILFTQT